MVTGPDNRPVPTPIALPAMVIEALQRLRYGDIRLTIHDGKLVQVDVTEKTRLAGS